MSLKSLHVATSTIHCRLCYRLLESICIGLCCTHFLSVQCTCHIWWPYTPKLLPLYFPLSSFTTRYETTIGSTVWIRNHVNLKYGMTWEKGATAMLCHVNFQSRQSRRWLAFNKGFLKILQVRYPLATSWLVIVLHPTHTPYKFLILSVRARAFLKRYSRIIVKSVRSWQAVVFWEAPVDSPGSRLAVTACLRGCD